jgi:hypothetical protein
MAGLHSAAAIFLATFMCGNATSVLYNVLKYKSPLCLQGAFACISGILSS